MFELIIGVVLAAGCFVAGMLVFRNNMQTMESVIERIEFVVDYIDERLDGIEFTDEEEKE